MEALIRREREQLLNCWCKVLSRRPTLIERPIASLRRIHLQNGSATGMDFRKVHDLFGWMAKQHVNCAGALYRTERFITSNPSERCGSRADCARHPGRQNVHIEHTVQAVALATAWNHSTEMRTLPQTLEWILDYSVATAMVHGEQDALPSLKSVPILPFARYANTHLRIWNVFSGTRIDAHSYTYQEHQAAIQDVIARFSEER